MTYTLKVSVVIPTHNRSAKLALTLDHLAVQTLATGWDVIVVANNCNDDTLESVRKRADHFPVPLRVIEELAPGAAAARNAGARRAVAEDVLFLDDDILVEPDCLERLAQDRNAHPDAWILGQGLPLPEHRSSRFGAFREAAMPPVSLDHPITSVAWFASGIALVPRAALETLGGYQEEFTEAALEDADLAIRAIRAGQCILFDPSLTFLHNDWAGMSIRDYCRRARIYLATAPRIAQRFGIQDHPWSALIVANRPPDWRHDRGSAIATKCLKRVAGAPASQAALFIVAEFLERIHAPTALLWPIYRVAVAGSMYAGYKEGLHRLAGSGHPSPDT